MRESKEAKLNGEKTMEEEKKCEKCGALNNGIDRITGEEKPIIAIIRTKNVCNSCFNEIKIDNKLLVDLGRKIPKSLITLKEKEEFKKRKEVRRVF